MPEQNARDLGRGVADVREVGSAAKRATDTPRARIGERATAAWPAHGRRAGGADQRAVPADDAARAVREGAAGEGGRGVLPGARGQRGGGRCEGGDGAVVRARRVGARRRGRAPGLRHAGVERGYHAEAGAAGAAVGVRDAPPRDAGAEGAVRGDGVAVRAAAGGGDSGRAGVPGDKGGVRDGDARPKGRRGARGEEHRVGAVAQGVA